MIRVSLFDTCFIFVNRVPINEYSCYLFTYGTVHQYSRYSYIFDPIILFLTLFQRYNVFYQSCLEKLFHRALVFEYHSLLNSLYQYTSFEPHPCPFISCFRGPTLLRPENLLDVSPAAPVLSHTSHHTILYFTPPVSSLDPEFRKERTVWGY